MFSLIYDLSIRKKNVSVTVRYIVNFEKCYFTAYFIVNN